MKSRWLAALGAGVAVWPGLLACSSDARTGAGAVAGAGVVAGAEAGAGAAPAAGASGVSSGGGNAGLPETACPEHPKLQRSEGTLVSLALQPVLAEKPFVFGQANALADGGSLIPLNFRFYVSEVSLLPMSGEAPIAVDLVTAAGSPEPYGVHLFNAEDVDSGTLRVLAPPGQYAGLSFALGLKLACNQQAPTTLSDPLTDVSQMTWPHLAGFLFLRYEGRYTAADGSDGADAGTNQQFPPLVHMGGDVGKELVPRITAEGALSVPANGRLEQRLRVVMDEIFKGATSDIDLGDVSAPLLASPGVPQGERLRRELPELHVFVLEP